jgi:tetratricopeptide (TPR) repeat protein
VEVPLRLARRENPAATDAFLLLADDPAPLASACERLGAAALPEVYLVRGGFLIVPRFGEAPPIPGAVRLRRLAGDLFAPVDAALLPALLPDEVASLTRNCGLVALPGGEVLAFDPANPLAVRGWLVPPQVRRAGWEPFPPRQDRPESLSVIERPTPPVAAVIEILRGGEPEGADPLPGAGSAGGSANVPEDARPASGSLLGRLGAGAGLAAGGFLVWLGKQFGAAGLAKLGGDLARRALERVPRLSEKVLGDQEAALREVLRQLQSGEVEKGLRRAPIAVPDPDRPARVGTDARLGHRDPRYSLRDLIGSGGGGATAWLGGGDVWAELAREYRRLAEEAVARGDFRRAAYLHGVLLRDLRSAANALMAGGLHRDAALLFRDRLHDPLAAAGAFDRAGDHDESLRLYVWLGEYERAAELLRRLGDEERAVAYFLRAADKLATFGQRLAAGELVRTQTHRRDLALGYYRRGWEGGSAEAVACGERLLDMYLLAEDRPAIDALLADAESRLADRPRDAGRFFNHAVRLGANLLPPDAFDDLADRVRLIFAGHLRAEAPSAGGLTDELFAGGRPWPAPVVRDATFAVRDHRRRPAVEAGPHAPPVKVASGTVTAVVAARGTSDVVVAAANGIVCWRVAEGRVVPVLPIGPGHVVALATDPQGQMVYALNANRRGFLLRCFAAERAGSFALTAEVRESGDFAADSEWYLQPSATFRDGDYRVTLVTPERRVTYVGRHLLSQPTDPFVDDGSPRTRLLVEAGGTWYWASGSVWYRPPGGEDRPVGHWFAPWSPSVHADSPLAQSAVDWITPESGVLEVAGVDAIGRVHWAEFDGRDPDNRRSRANSAAHPGGYVAACLVGPRSVAAVTRGNEVHWLRATGTTLDRSRAAKLGIPSPAVALVARSEPVEVIAILADGYAVRLPQR